MGIGEKNSLPTCLKQVTGSIVYRTYLHTNRPSARCEMRDAGSLHGPVHVGSGFQLLFYSPGPERGHLRCLDKDGGDIGLCR